IRIGRAIYEKDFEEMEKNISDYLLKTASYYDTADEAFYQGLVLGLCAILNKRYDVLSNRESGLGRFDIQLFPRISGLPGFIFELKIAENSKSDLERKATEALKQISDKKYDTELKKRGVKSIIKIGMAFHGKNAIVKKEI
ncbi:MAG: PD-(D/E)XK nuclease domain-containing protein, partial [Lachnospiraceae bacterium]|nr:PD-(D/E)XK nuclease domain-containing protein [Lachnospiraceae bacterium]